MELPITPTDDLINITPQPAGRPLRIEQRIASLGIPEHELTPSVRFTLSAILEKLDDVGHELKRTKDNLTELEQLVDVDCLVPIPNRRAFLRRTQWALSMLERYGHPSTILYFDLNDFKSVNDTYGHAAGDLAIRHVSQILSNTMRDSDFIGRIGGDEFAIIMYHATEDAAKKRGEKIAETIAATPFTFNGKPMYINTATGHYALKKGDDPESALSAADLNMYIDKRKYKELKAQEAAA